MRMQMFTGRRQQQQDKKAAERQGGYDWLSNRKRGAKWTERGAVNEELAFLSEAGQASDAGEGVELQPVMIETKHEDIGKVGGQFWRASGEQLKKCALAS